MKKLLTLLVLVMGLAAVGRSQTSKVSWYGFSSDSLPGHEFTPLVSGTSLDTLNKLKGNTYDQKVVVGTNAIATSYTANDSTEGFPIGFNFTYNGQVVNRFIVVSRGYIKLGKDYVKLSDASPSSSMTPNSIGVCPDMTTYGRYNTSVKYSLDGTGPDRVLTVEFLNIGISGWSAATQTTTDSISFQIKLYESSNNIDIVFGKNRTSSGSAWFRIGLRNDATDAHFRSPSVTGIWKGTTTLSTGSAGNTTVMNVADGVTDGLTYTFTVPLACETPATNNVTAISMTSTYDGVTGSYTVGTTPVDGYMVIFSTKKVLDSLPKDGVTYSNGTFMGADNKIVVYGKDTVFTGSQASATLPSGTKYYVYIYSYNEFCSGGPKYSTTYYTDSITTKAGLPSKLDVTALTESSITLSVAPNEINDSVIVLITDERATNSNYVVWYGVFGVPEGNYNVGDEVNGGGTVIYKGLAGDFAYAPDTLPSNKVYFFGAFSKYADGTYSSGFISSDTITLAKLPFYEDYVQHPFRSQLYGWETVPVDAIQTNGSGGLSDAGYASSSVLNTSLNQRSVTTWETPYINFGDNDGYLRFEYVQSFGTPTRPYYYYCSPEYWTANDSVLFETTTDGVTYTKRYAITRYNTKNDFRAQTGDFTISAAEPHGIALRGLKNENVKIRVSFIINNGLQVRVKMRPFNVEIMSECDRVGARDIEAVSDKYETTVTWSSDFAETFDIRYRRLGEQEWKTDRVNGYSTVLTTEVSGAKYEFQIRSVCGIGTYSDWTEFTFMSGYVVPFFDNFDNSMYLASADLTGTLRRVAPKNWSSYYYTDLGESLGGDMLADSGWGNLAECVVNENITNSRPLYTWKGTGNITAPIVDGTNYALVWMNQMTGVRMNWLVSPVMDFTDETKLSFDMAMLNGTQPVTFVDSKAKVYVAYLPESESDTIPINPSNLLLTLDSLAIMQQIGDSGRIEVSLSQSEIPVGRGRIAIQAIMFNTLQSNNPLIYIDNIAIDKECLAVEDLAVTYTSLDSINLVWSAQEGATSYLLGANLEMIEVTGTSYKYVPAGAGTYAFAVGYVCNGDTVWGNTVLTKVFTGVCEVPGNVQEALVSTTSVTISWDGEEMEGFRVRQRVSGSESEWEIFVVQGTVHTVGPLEQGKFYDVQVQRICGNGDGDTSEYSAVITVSPREVTCFAPTSITVVPSYYTASVSWENNAATYQYGVRRGTSGSWTGYSVVDTVITLTDLTPETLYQVRVRSVCTAGDTSAWSGFSEFITTEVPACPIPTGLTVGAVTSTTAAVSWTAPADYGQFLLTYHDVNVAEWDTAGTYSSEVSRELTGLTPNTAYAWRVRNFCSDNRTSGWANGDNITTQEASIEDIKGKSSFSIYANNGQINILNPNNLYVERVVITSTIGVSLQNYAIRSTDNVLIPTTLKNKVVVVSIYGKNGSVQSEKVLLK
ncbi:MAG: fibronectin type III domain-containing protein [Bacteroidales bacterium]|jgi:hypothetical protein|nr:fibronectin type III domain-containing protein [Bacteroidales bacterium]